MSADNRNVVSGWGADGWYAVVACGDIEAEDTTVGRRPVAVEVWPLVGWGVLEDGRGGQVVEGLVSSDSYPGLIESATSLETEAEDGGCWLMGYTRDPNDTDLFRARGEERLDRLQREQRV